LRHAAACEPSLGNPIYAWAYADRADWTPARISLPLRALGLATAAR
jgi:hypothetical protein